MSTTPQSPYGAQPQGEPHFRRAPTSSSQKSGLFSGRSRSNRAETSRSGARSQAPHSSANSYAGNSSSPASRPTVRLAGSSSRYQSDYRQSSSAGSTGSDSFSSTHQAAYPGASEPTHRPFGAPREPMPQLRGSRKQAYYGHNRSTRNSVIGQPLRRGGSRSGSNLNFSRAGMSLNRGMSRRRTVAYDGSIRVHRVAAVFATILITLVTWFAQATTSGIVPTAESSLLDMQIMALPDIPISTPISQWKKGEAPHLYQTDPIWSTKTYAGGTIHDNACGPTALTMAYVYITGKTDMTPLTMAQWADEHTYAPTGATEWSFMTEGAASFGLSSTMVNSDRATITSALKAGKIVISLMNEGDFTNNGHFIVLTDIDEYGNVTLNDPFSGTRSAHTWKIGTICRQSTYSWVFETN